MPNLKLVTSPAELSEVCSLLMNEPVIAVDTEFFWERTFYPILGVVQLATENGDCYLIDTIVLKDTKELAPVLENKNIVKIFHDAPQDLGIIAIATGATPCNIFDTRTSAGFAGFESITSLQNLLKQTLDINLPKSETRSNWIKRPLTEAQISYAADDVLYLPALREYLIKACTDSTVRKWMEEENSLLDNPGTFNERDPWEMYKRVKGSSRLKARQLAVLRELAAWREKKARRRDLPRNRVLQNTTLIDLARKVPSDITAARSVNDFPQKMPVGVVTELLNAIQRGMECPDAECPKAAEDNTDRRNNLKVQTKELLSHIQVECEQQKIDAALVASRADAEAYILNKKENAPTLKLNNGWRREIVAGWPQ